jgi:cell division protein FtsQ
MTREKKSVGIRWRRWLIGAAILAVCAGVSTAAYRAHRFAGTDARFTLVRERRDALNVLGTKYVSRSKVINVFAKDFGRSVYSIPLDERRRRLLAIDWVEDASVSRIWPDRLVVEIRERKPVAFASLPSGAMLIDASGVLMEPPAQAQFEFPVLSGISQDQTDTRRAEQVAAYIQLRDEMRAWFKDISEVDVANPQDLTIVARVGNRALQLMLGDGEYGRRYKAFLSNYPEIQKRSPDVRTFDLRMNDRITAKE